MTDIYDDQNLNFIGLNRSIWSKRASPKEKKVNTMFENRKPFFIDFGAHLDIPDRN